MKVKMYCVFAKEAVQKMNGVRGKMCTQAGHAYIHALIYAQEHFPEHVKAYLNSDHAYKITLIVDTVDDLKVLQEAYKDICATKLVTDKGFTVFTEPTTTCLGIGPIPENLVGLDLQNIKTFC